MDARRGPFIGPRPFGREDGSLFFGREHEASDLLSLTIAHPAVLLYAQSGAGKTSLLQAKLLPMLEARGSQVLGPARVGGSLPAGLGIAEVGNVFLYNAVTTLGAGEAAGLPGSSLHAALAAWPRPEGMVRRILVFDQFEELFTAFPDRWSDRKEVFEQIGEALDDDPRLRVLFAMREEYLAAVDPFVGLLPERLRTRFRLERLRRDAALLAVQGPLAGTGRAFGPGAAEKLVDNLLKVPTQGTEGISPEGLAEFVEPVHLQVVCQSLWRSLPPGDAPIDEGLIDEYADVDQALSDFYEDCLRRASEATGAREGALRRWFVQALITAQGTRGLVYKGTKTTGGLLNEAAKVLEDLHLLRVEIRAGAVWYELAHDRLIEPIRRSNARWNAERSGVGQLYESRAERWVEGGRRPQDLLSETEAEQAAAWLESPEAEQLDPSERLRDFIETSREQAVHKRAETAARIARRQRFQILVLAAGLLAALWLALYAWRAQRKAEDATLVERGKVAKYLAGRGELFDAAVFGIRAVAPRVASGREIPAEALGGLRAAVGSLGASRWLRVSQELIDEVVISDDGTLAATGTDHSVTVWNAIEGRPLFRKPMEDDRVRLMNFSPDGRYFWVRNNDHLFLWDARSGRSIERLEDQLAKGAYLRFTQDGDRAAVALPASNPGEVRFFENRSGRILGQFEPPPGFRGLQLSPQGRRLVLWWDTAEGSIFELRELPSGRVLAEMARFPAPEYLPPDRPLLAFSNDDRWVVLGSRQPLPGRKGIDVLLFETVSGRRIAVHETSLRRLISLAFSHEKELDRLVLLGIEEAMWDVLISEALDGRTGKLVARRTFELPPKHRLVSHGAQALISSAARSADEPESTLWNLLTGATRTVPYPWVDSASEGLSRGLKVLGEGAAAQVIDLDKPPLDVESLSATELLRIACRHLLYLPEREQVEEECGGPRLR